ncbi:major facilitator superfamily domain-containing protein [Microdochium bolleyi]|uniref:Major facilitator superfamily domain-containing protein n=1 Tax=Microdochium bolleyi TaxID=196109 RepID=A0A136J5Y6_9PEZI|nr:major facilitator superfamily domain-containing protein [Microdochium bolleyi]
MRFGRAKPAAAASPAALTETSDSPAANTAAVEPTPAAAIAGDDDDENIVYPTGLRLFLLLISIFSTIFLIALDRLIIATAIPAITDEFHSLQDVGWYGSAYLLTTCSFQLMFGKLYKFYSVKATFLACVLLFEVGSAICGAAPNSVAFIIGRAVQGVGAAGIFSGCIVILVYAVPLHKRPMYQGLFGAVFGIASVMGPLVGGAFTSNVTWRWCFWINLPFGAVAIVLVGFILNVPTPKAAGELTTRQKLAQLDPFGTLALVPGVVCLLLALQWGGVTYAWNSGRIIALLVIGIALFFTFVGIQIFMPETATLPPRLFKQRSISAGVWITCCVGAHMMIFIYFIPIWFQAIKGDSAVDSGIHVLPLTLGMVVASISSGLLISKVGYYTPFMLIGVCIMSVGAGLFLTFELDTPMPRWIGFQILYGFGLGWTFQGPNLAAQTVLPTADVSMGVSLMFFTQLLSGAIFLCVGQNVLTNELLNRLTGIAGVTPEFIENTGATSLSGALPAAVRGVVLNAYNLALRSVFTVGVAFTCLTIVGALLMEWRSVKSKKQQQDEAAAKAAGGAGGKGVVDEEEKRAATAGSDGEIPSTTTATAAAAGHQTSGSSTPRNSNSMRAQKEEV